MARVLSSSRFRNSYCIVCVLRAQAQNGESEGIRGLGRGRTTDMVSLLFCPQWASILTIFCISFSGIVEWGWCLWPVALELQALHLLFKWLESVPSYRSRSWAVCRSLQLFSVGFYQRLFGKKLLKLWMTLKKDKVTIPTIYYSTIAPFYHIRAKERAKYATLLHCRTGQKYGLKAKRQNGWTKL